MKTITLIPLTTGTGIGHFISSFAMIEKDKMAILDFDFNSTVNEVLSCESVLYSNNTNEVSVKFYLTRFNNLLFSTLNKKSTIEDINKTFNIDHLKDNSILENINFRIVHYPYVYQDNELYEIIAKSDSVVFFGDYTFDTKLALKEILKRCQKNKFGMLLRKPEESSFSLEYFSREIETNQIKVFGEIPYNLKFQLATIQKKVLLEYNDKHLSDIIIKAWNNIKNEANSITQVRIELEL